MEHFNGKLNSYSTYSARLKKQVLEVNNVTSHLILKLISEKQAEQLNILISKSKTNAAGVSSDCEETSGTIKSTLQFDSSDVSPIKTEVIEKDDVKISPARFPPTCYRKNNKNSRAVASGGTRGQLPSPDLFSQTHFFFEFRCVLHVKHRILSRSTPMS